MFGIFFYDAVLFWNHVDGGFFFSKLDAERSSSPWLCVWHYVEKLEWSASACPGCFAKSVFPSCDRAAAWKRCCASIQCLKSQQLSPFTQSLRLKAPKLAVLHRCESLLVVCYWLVSVWVGSAWCCSGLQQLASIQKNLALQYLLILLKVRMLKNTVSFSLFCGQCSIHLRALLFPFLCRKTTLYVQDHHHPSPPIY